LRSPLAAISGFSELLLDRCEDKLSGSALSHLRFVREAASRMNGRATNLLRLARANRAKINREPVNLSALAQTVMGDLMAREPQRACAWNVLPNLVIDADVSLMRVTLVNLLENAWTHTRGRAEPRIEFGLVQDTDEPIFFVRDNGEGFDQETADRLFNPDSRFQQASVLPSAGIGLRTVRRIVTRLGGRVWAEGAVGRGATFYFTPAPSAPAGGL
jgi:signal transduction histidine kinase